MEEKEQGLNFFPLNRNSLRIAVFVDAGFGTNPDLLSQLGFIVILMDHTARCECDSLRKHQIKKVTGSFLAAELYAMVQDFDVSLTIRLKIIKIIG